MELTTQHFQQLHASLWPHSRTSDNRSDPFITETVGVGITATYFDLASLTGCSTLSRAIIVRDQYKKFRSLIEDEEQKHSIEPSRYKPPMCLLLGQPGTGKTSCLYYILVYRLHRGLPTALEFRAEDFLLFDSAGVHAISGIRKGTSELPPGTWALTVYGKSVTRPCPPLAHAPVVIQDGYGLHRTWLSTVYEKYTMRLPQWHEMEAIGVLQNWDIKRLRSIFEDWGPSIRICKRLVTHPPALEQDHLAWMERSVQKAANLCARCVADSASQSIDVPGLDFDGPSSIFFFEAKPEYTKGSYPLEFSTCVTVPGRITRQLLTSAGEEFPDELPILKLHQQNGLRCFRV